MASKFSDVRGVDLRWICRVLCAVLLWIGTSECEVFAEDTQDSGFETRVRPLLSKYCFSCHGPDGKQGNLSLDRFPSHADALKEPALWWKVLKNLRSGVMPPEGEPRPNTVELHAIVSWIKFEVFGIDPTNVDPGRIGVRRLNRREYENTVNELMGIRFDAAIALPPDDSGFGFDNVGEALSF